MERKGFLAWPVWGGYALLALVGIPWYWPVDDSSMLFGFPRWTICSLGASLLASFYTTWLLIKRWPVSLDQEENETPPLSDDE